jgi:hypothetical protein
MNVNQIRSGWLEDASLAVDFVVGVRFGIALSIFRRIKGNIDNSALCVHFL